MKRLILVFKLCIYYLIGMILFTTIFTTTEILIVNNLGMQINFLNSYMHNFLNGFLIYTMLYFVVILSIRLYDVLSIEKLNKKLQKIKERRNL